MIGWLPNFEIEGVVGLLKIEKFITKFFDIPVSCRLRYSGYCPIMEYFLINHRKVF